MTTHSMGTKLNDQMILDLARKILNANAYQGQERVEKTVGEFIVRYLKGEIGFLKAKAELEEDFPITID